MNSRKPKTTELFLPSLKSNIKNDPVFYNNTNFIANTSAFYDDLKRKLNSNERSLEEICQRSLEKINKYNQNRLREENKLQMYNQEEES